MNRLQHIGLTVAVPVGVALATEAAHQGVNKAVDDLTNICVHAQGNVVAQKAGFCHESVAKAAEQDFDSHELGILLSLGTLAAGSYVLTGDKKPRFLSGRAGEARPASPVRIIPMEIMPVEFLPDGNPDLLQV